MISLLQDVHFGLRMLVKSFGFTLVAALTLALGTGANSAIFTIVNSFLLRPLPVRDAGQLTVLAYQQKMSDLHSTFSFSEFQDIRSQSSGAFSDMLAYQIGIDGISINGKANRIVTGYVTGNYFEMLGIKSHRGRLILPSEGLAAGSDPVLVLSYSYWKARFNGDESLIGAKVLFNGHPVTIVGIAPQGFHGTYSMLEMQAYLPISMASLSSQPSDFMTNREIRSFQVFGRLRVGMNVKQAQNLLAVVAQRLSHQYPKIDEGLTLNVYPELLARPQPQVGNQIVGLSTIVLFLAAMVLALACVNVANMLLIRAISRQREMAIRAALGANRRKLVRQLLTESVMLALLGGVGGILLGIWMAHLLHSIPLQTDLPLLLDFGFDWRVFTYSFLITFLTGIVVGLLPAIRASRANLNSTLREGGRGSSAVRHRFRNTIIVAQIAGSLTLLIVAGLFLRSSHKAQQTNLGFNPDHVINLSVDPHEIGYSDTQGMAFYKTLLQNVRELPGVQSASLASSVPMGYYFNRETLQIPGHIPPPNHEPPSVVYNVVSPGYVENMGISVHRGRAFTEADDGSAKSVAIINQTMAERYWPHDDPIGRQFALTSDLARPIEIVGVVRDSKYELVTDSVSPFFYLPLAQHYSSYQTLQVRTSGAQDVMTVELLQQIRNISPDLPIFDVKTMTAALNTINGLLAFKFAAALTGGLGIVGLLLALVGVYGVVSYAVGQRTHEIGIRIALGAQSWNIMNMIFKEGLLIVAAGVMVGILGGFVVARFLGSFLTGVSPNDLVTYLTVSLLLTLISLAACYIPARRALRVDPLVVLRYE
jgi:macrolide transport system ATP-binding/permease protein